MWRRMTVCAVASVLGSGALILAQPASAHAYAQPASGYVTAVAGAGAIGSRGDGGSATSASLGGNGDVAIDPSTRNVVIADAIENQVRVVAVTSGTFYGQTMAADNIYRIAGTGRPGYTGDFGPGPSATLSSPTGVTVDSSGDVIIADTNNHVIRVVAMTDGVIFTLVGTGTAGFSGDGGPAESAQFNHPYGVALDNAGNLLIADTYNNRLRVAAASSGTFYGQAMTGLDIYTIAGTGTFGFSGDGGTASAATMRYPAGLTVDGNGNVVFADWWNHRVRVVAEASGSFYGIAMTVGKMYTIAGDGHAGFEGDGGLATATGLNVPRDVAIDSGGNVVVADQLDHRVRLVAGHTSSYSGQSQTAGHIYTIAGNGTAASTGNGGLATAANLYFPSGVAVDPSGTVVVETVAQIRAVGVVSCGAPSASPSQLTATSAVVPTSLAPPQSSTSQWKATVHNPSATTESCGVAKFTVDSGSLNATYSAVSQGPGCAFVSAVEIDCSVGALAPNAGNDPALDATASVAIQATGVSQGSTITGTVTVSSNFTGTPSAQSMVAVNAPTPGQTTAFVPPGGTTYTDTVPTPTDSIIAAMMLPGHVAGNGAAVRGGIQPNTGLYANLISMNIQPTTYDTTLCPTPSSCLGKIMQVDPFFSPDISNTAPATLTFKWDPSAVGAGVNVPLYMHVPAQPVVTVPACVKVKKVQTVLPCVSKRSIAKNVVALVVLTLSLGDPGFVRK